MPKPVDNQPAENQRVDIWLWHARFFKTRTLSSRICRAGKVRINGQKFTRAKSPITVGDVLTFPQPSIIRIIKVASLSHRRGPAPEAQTLYEDMTPPPEIIKQEQKSKVARRDKGSGRPTKTERRATDRLRDVFPD